MKVVHLADNMSQVFRFYKPMADGSGLRALVEVKKWKRTASLVTTVFVLIIIIITFFIIII